MDGRREGFEEVKSRSAGLVLFWLVFGWLFEGGRLWRRWLGDGLDSVLGAGRLFAGTCATALLLIEVKLSPGDMLPAIEDLLDFSGGEFDLETATRTPSL